jgi:hypothetical protein
MSSTMHGTTNSNKKNILFIFGSRNSCVVNELSFNGLPFSFCDIDNKIALSRHYARLKFLSNFESFLICNDGFIQMLRRFYTSGYSSFESLLFTLSNTVYCQMGDNEYEIILSTISPILDEIIQLNKNMAISFDDTDEYDENSSLAKKLTHDLYRNMNSTYSKPDSTNSMIPIKTDMVTELSTGRRRLFPDSPKEF